MEFTDTALIMKTGRMREHDLWVKLLSSARGVFTAFAFGGLKSRRRFCGCLDVFNLVRFRVKASRNGKYFSLEEGQLVRSPSRLRHDMERLGMAANCLKFVEAVQVGQEGGGRGCACGWLLVGVLDALETAQVVSRDIPVFFRAGIMAEQGLAPELGRCFSCGAPEARAWKLAVDRGALVCDDCASRQKRLRFCAHSLTNSGLEALRWIMAAPPGEWPRLDASPQTKSECARAIDGLVYYHLGIVWENGRFRRM